MSAGTRPEKPADLRPTAKNQPLQPGAVVSPVIHRVCIQCNNMFQVAPDRFDSKQCPNCHKG